MVSRVVTEEYIGRKFGRLTITGSVEQVKGHKTRVIATCDCGQTTSGKEYNISSLLSGNTRTCGCTSLPVIGFNGKSINGGLEYTVVGYQRTKGRKTIVLVKFKDTGYEYGVEGKNALSGNVRDAYSKIIAGVGYLGKGKYKSDKVGYQVWLDMIKRCYSPKSEHTARCYSGVTVDVEWHNYQNFAKWFYENYTCGWQVDKDFLVRGNRVYGPETCVFLPRHLNGFLVGGLKRGISRNPISGSWKAACNDGDKDINGRCVQTSLGYYKSETVALQVYKDFKLNKLEELKVLYGDKVPLIVFENIKEIILELQ